MPKPPKPTDQLVAEYMEAPSPMDWVAAEVSEYLELDDDERDHLFRTLAATNDDVWETRVRPRDTVSFAVRIVRGDTAHVGWWTEVPTPQWLLSLCAGLAEVGDTVVVRQTFANGDETELSAYWPFGMSQADVMTSPLGYFGHDETAERPWVEDATRGVTIDSLSFDGAGLDTWGDEPFDIDGVTFLDGLGDDHATTDAAVVVNVGVGGGWATIGAAFAVALAAGVVVGRAARHRFGR